MSMQPTRDRLVTDAKKALTEFAFKPAYEKLIVFLRSAGENARLTTRAPGNFRMARPFMNSLCAARRRPI